MKLFPARYYGSCAECREPLEPGDWVGYIDGVDGICCEECVEEDN